MTQNPKYKLINIKWISVILEVKLTFSVAVSFVMLKKSFAIISNFLNFVATVLATLPIRIAHQGESFHLGGINGL